MTLSLKAIVPAAIVTLGLAGATLAQTATTAATAAAQRLAPTLTELSINIGLTPEMIERGQQLQADMVKFGYDEDDVDNWCASKRSIRNGLVEAGFNDADIVDRLTQFRVRIEGLHLADGWVYSMVVNRCTGNVTNVAPIYRAADLA